jgi:hypothetical protein
MFDILPIPEDFLLLGLVEIKGYPSEQELVCDNSN